MALTVQAQLDSSCVDRTRKGIVIVIPPLAIVAAAAAVNIYDQDAGDPPLQQLDLQNVGNGGTVKVMVNDTATAAMYNRILAADTGAGNGLGGAWSIPMGPNVKKVSVFSTGGTTLAIFKVVNPSNTRV